MRIRKNEQPYKDLTVAAEFSSIVTPSSLLIMIFSPLAEPFAPTLSFFLTCPSLMMKNVSPVAP